MEWYGIWRVEIKRHHADGYIRLSVLIVHMLVYETWVNGSRGTRKQYAFEHTIQHTE